MTHQEYICIVEALLNLCQTDQWMAVAPTLESVCSRLILCARPEVLRKGAVTFLDVYSLPLG